MKDISTTVVDEVPYASPDDVLTWVRNREEFSDPGREQVYSLLLDRSDFIDTRTRRAWRTREATFTRSLKLTNTQKSSRHRRRSRTRLGKKRRSPNRVAEPWVPAQMPHLDLQEFDPEEGDSFQLLLGSRVKDLSDDVLTIDTSTSGDLDTAAYLERDRGRFQIHLYQLTVGDMTRMGRIISGAKRARVNYRYGADESAQVNDGEDMNDPAESVPGSLREACHKLVAADIMRTDQLGDLFRSSGEDIELSSPANSLESSAMESIQEHARGNGGGS